VYQSQAAIASAIPASFGLYSEKDSGQRNIFSSFDGVAATNLGTAI
jgi:hypothetical protein